MKTLEKTLTYFQSFDGKEFLNEKDCLTYEKEQKRLKQRKGYIQSVLNNLLNENSQNKSLFFESKINDVENNPLKISLDNVKIYVTFNNDETTKEEVFESLDSYFTLDDIQTIKDELFINNGFVLNIPYDYFSK